MVVGSKFFKNRCKTKVFLIKKLVKGSGKVFKVIKKLKTKRKIKKIKEKIIFIFLFCCRVILIFLYPFLKYCPEFIQNFFYIYNMSGSKILDVLYPEFIQFYLSRICSEFFYIQNLSNNSEQKKCTELLI